MYQTGVGFIWTTGTPDIDICLQRSGAYAGKAIARTVRAHVIFDAALNVLMLTDVLNSHLPIQPDKSNSNNNTEIATVPPDDLADEVSNKLDLDEVRAVYDKLMDTTVSVEDIKCQYDVLKRIKDRLHKHAESANVSYRTLVQ